MAKSSLKVSFSYHEYLDNKLRSPQFWKHAHVPEKYIAPQETES